MNAQLKETKTIIKQIDKFCNSKPIPTEEDVKFFISSNGFSYFEKYAINLRNAVFEREWLYFQKKVNKSRTR